MYNHHVKYNPKDPPRIFKVGTHKKFNIYDCGNIYLNNDEQLTFITKKGAELDVTKKDWGFYATPSLNGRLLSFGLKSALIRNKITKKYFVVIVEEDKEKSFEKYLEQESCEIVIWLCDEKDLKLLPK